MEIEIVDFIPKDADTELLNIYFDFAEASFKETFKDDPLIPRDLHYKLLLTKRSGYFIKRKLLKLRNQNKVIGRAHIMVVTEENTGFEDNKHNAEIYIDILKEYDNFEFSKSALLSALDEISKFEYVTTIDTCSYKSNVWRFWEKLNARLVLEGALNRVYLKDIDWDMIEEWRKEGQKIAKSEQIDLFSFENCPEDIIEEFTSTYTTLMRLVPLGDFDIIPEPEIPKTRKEKEENNKQTGYKWITFATREKNGDISGLTEILYSEAKPYEIEQELTGVKLEYRGRGIGKWLKAEMIYFITNNFPLVEYITTGNADMNAPMLSINSRIGFKRYLTEKCYSSRVNNLRAKLTG